MMNKKSLGEFISILRRAKGMTQKELAEKLYVSDKAVSRWERDESAPDLSLLPAIAEIFDVSVDELLKGEKSTKVKTVEFNEKEFNNKIRRRKQKFSNLSLISLLLIFIGFIMLIIFYNTKDYKLLGLLLPILLNGISIFTQIVINNNFLLYDFDEEYNNKSQTYNNELINKTKNIVFINTILIFVYCVVQIPITNGIPIVYVLITIFSTLILLETIYECCVKKRLASKNIYFIKDVDTYETKKKVLKKLFLGFICSFLFVFLIYISFDSISIEKFGELKYFETFEDFKKYVEDGHEYEIIDEIDGEYRVYITKGNMSGQYRTLDRFYLDDENGNPQYYLVCRRDIRRYLFRNDGKSVAAILAEPEYLSALDMKGQIGAIIELTLLLDSLVFASLVMIKNKKYSV